MDSRAKVVPASDEAQIAIDEGRGELRIYFDRVLIRLWILTVHSGFRENPNKSSGFSVQGSGFREEILDFRFWILERVNPVAIRIQSKIQNLKSKISSLNPELIDTRKSWSSFDPTECCQYFPGQN